LISALRAKNTATAKMTSIAMDTPTTARAAIVSSKAGGMKVLKLGATSRFWNVALYDVKLEEVVKNR